MGVKAFVIVFGVLSYVDSDKIFDFDLKKCHFRFNERLNQAVFPFGVYPRDIPVEFTYSVFAFIASIISFAVVKIQVKFSHCFYVYTSIDIEDTKDELNDANPEPSNTKLRMRKILRAMMYINFIAPVFVCMLFINPLAKKYIVPQYLSNELYIFQKLFFIFLACIFRAFTFREEV
jgi:ABC-type Fe3+-siderophore transport system permease subunit